MEEIENKAKSVNKVTILNKLSHIKLKTVTLTRVKSSQVKSSQVKSSHTEWERLAYVEEYFANSGQAYEYQNIDCWTDSYYTWDKEREKVEEREEKR